MSPVQLATTDTIAGRYVAHMALVIAAVPYFGTTYGEGIKDLNGQTSADVPAVLEARRVEVLLRLQRKAEAIGADAVVGVRLTHREISGAWKELCAYGTAVTLLGEVSS